MNVYLHDRRRVVRKVGEKWEFGHPEEPAVFNHFGGFQEVVTAWRHPNECVLWTLLGIDDSGPLYFPRNTPALDPGALSAVQHYKRHLEASIRDVEDSLAQAQGRL